MAADSGDLGANGDLGDGDFRSVRKVFNGVCAGGGVAGGGVPARERLRGGCLEGGSSSDRARGVGAGGAMPTSGSGLGSGSGVASVSETDFRVAVGFRFERTALGFAGVVAGASESPERTRRPPRAGFATEDGPGVVVVRRDFRRGVGATTSSSNSSSSGSSLTGSSSSASGSEPSDSTTLRRDAAARLAGLTGVIVDIGSTELNGRFVVGDALRESGEEGSGRALDRYLLYLMYLIHAMRQAGRGRCFRWWGEVRYQNIGRPGPHLHSCSSNPNPTCGGPMIAILQMLLRLSLVVYLQILLYLLYTVITYISYLFYLTIPRFLVSIGSPRTV